MSDPSQAIYLGLTHLDLGGAQVDFGDGILLREANARFLLPLTLVTTRDKPNEHHPAFVQLSAREVNVTAELTVPTAGDAVEKSFATGRLLVFLLRLMTNPEIGCGVVSRQSLREIRTVSDVENARMHSAETVPRHFLIQLVDKESVVESLDWVRDHWKVADRMYNKNAEFKLAADAIDGGQFIPNSALALVSLWGALEALFSPSTAELKFRVSSLIAAYLEAPGSARLTEQKRIATLYDKRSAAAHGKPRHAGDDLLATFELLRRVLIRMVEQGAVPSKDKLEETLFGA